MGRSDKSRAPRIERRSRTGGGSLWPSEAKQSEIRSRRSEVDSKRGGGRSRFPEAEKVTQVTEKRRTGKNESTKRVDTKGGTAVGSAPPRKSSAALLRGEPEKRSGNGRLTAKTVQNTKAAPQVESGEAE